MAAPVLLEVERLGFQYRPDLPLVLEDVSLEVQAGERWLLAGPNGAGKTTLLRLVAGRHLIDGRVVRVLGRPAFHDTSLAAEVALLGGPFPVSVDVRVGDMLSRLPMDGARARRLMTLLGVDEDWHLHRISDGQRRRVQLLLGLLPPSRLLLLDEVTTDLDLLGRSDLLAFLREESEARGAGLLYATHIFDRLESWATHLAYLDRGRLWLSRRLDEIEDLEALRRQGTLSPLAALVEGWMRQGPPAASAAALDPQGRQTPRSTEASFHRGTCTHS
jgi:CCR4-NOT complex subunit CAF16